MSLICLLCCLQSSAQHLPFHRQLLGTFFLPNILCHSLSSILQCSHRTILSCTELVSLGTAGTAPRPPEREYHSAAETGLEIRPLAYFPIWRVGEDADSMDGVVFLCSITGFREFSANHGVAVLGIIPNCWTCFLQNISSCQESACHDFDIWKKPTCKPDLSLLCVQIKRSFILRSWRTP